MSRGNYLSSSEAAELLHVHPETLRRWTSKGVIEAEKTAGGHRRYLNENVEQLRRRIGGSAPDPKLARVEIPEEVLESHENLVLLTQRMADLGCEPDSICKAVSVEGSFGDILEECVYHSEDPQKTLDEIINAPRESFPREQIALLLHWMSIQDYEAQQLASAVADPEPFLKEFKAGIPQLTITFV